MKTQTRPRVPQTAPPTEDANAKNLLDQSPGTGTIQVGEGVIQAPTDQSTELAKVKQNDDNQDKVESLNLEIERADNAQIEQHQAFIEARDKEINKQQIAGAGYVDYELATEKGKKAAEKVRMKGLLQRGEGYYVLSPFPATSAEGNRIDVPVGMKLTDDMVSRLKNTRVRHNGRTMSELDYLVEQEVVEDFMPRRED